MWRTARITPPVSRHTDGDFTMTVRTTPRF
jgi:hypothetical protein